MKISYPGRSQPIYSIFDPTIYLIFRHFVLHRSKRTEFATAGFGICLLRWRSRVPDRIWMSPVGGLLIEEARRAPPCPLLANIVQQLALGITDLLPHEQHSQGEGCLQRGHSNWREPFQRRLPLSILIQFCCFVIFNASSFDLSARISEGTFAEENSSESFTRSLWMIFPGETNRETRCLEDFRGVNVGEGIGLKDGLWQVRQVIERIPEWKFYFVCLWCFLSILILFCIFKSVKSSFPSWEERWRFCENRIWWIVLFTKFRAVTDHVNFVASFELFST